MTVNLFKALLFAAACAHAQPAPIKPILDQACLGCHNKSSNKGGLDLTSLPFDLKDRATRERWIRIHDRVEKGERLATIHYNSDAKLGEAKSLISDSYHLGERAPREKRPLIRRIIGA